MLQLYVFDLKKRTKEGRLKWMCSVSIKIHKTKKETETSQHVVCCHFTIMKITWHQKLSFVSTVTNRWLIAAVLSYFNYSSNSDVSKFMNFIMSLWVVFSVAFKTNSCGFSFTFFLQQFQHLQLQFIINTII